MLLPATRLAPLYGLVLCGGESRRMGRDKARIELGRRSLLERAIAVLEPLCEEVWLASGPRPRYLDYGRLELVDRRPGSGPLAGLEAGLLVARARAPRAWLAVLACDMPGVRSEDFRALAGEAEGEELDSCCLSSERGTEPLAGIYSSELLESVSAALDARACAMTDPARFPARHGRLPRCATRPGSGPQAVRNLNTPNDLESVRA